MKKCFRTISIILTGSTLALMLFSFTIRKNITDDFMQQLGISKMNADSKITVSLLEGYLDGQEVRNIRNIALGNRTAITKDLLAYTRQHTGSAAFIKEYSALRVQKKPVLTPIQTPEDMQRGMADQARKSIAELEDKLKKADASTKPMLDKILASVRSQLQQIEDPANRSIVNYRQAYADMAKSNDALHQERMAAWEKEYPADHRIFIKHRLLQFLDETKDIDFGAALYEQKGMKYFSNPAYERKSDRWKMAFRAGAEVINPARTYVQEWVQSLP